MIITAAVIIVISNNNNIPKIMQVHQSTFHEKKQTKTPTRGKKINILLTTKLQSLFWEPRTHKIGKRHSLTLKSSQKKDGLGTPTKQHLGRSQG